MRRMQIGIAAIRGARVATRFVLPAARRRERRLGLERASRGSLVPLGRRASHGPRSATVNSLRARSGLAAGAKTYLPISPRLPLASRPRISWTQGASTTVRRLPAAGAAPWRG